jgi:hypothetical protein
MKKFYESKTFWFNVLFLLGAVAAYFGFADFKPDSNTVELASVVVAVINIILRFMTSQAIR